MKKIFVFLLLAAMLSSFSLAVPPWKQTPEKTIIVENRTIIVQNATQAQEGLNWEAIGAIVGIIAGIAAIIGWFITRKRRSITSSYLREINNIFNRYRNDPNKCESELYSFKDKIEGALSKGKLSEESFSLLDSRIDKYIAEARKGIIGTFRLSPETRRALNEMLKDGIITGEEYERFSKMAISELPKQEMKKLERLMKKWKEKGKSQWLR